MCDGGMSLWWGVGEACGRHAEQNDDVMGGSASTTVLSYPNSNEEL